LRGNSGHWKFKFMYNWPENVYQILVNYLQHIKILSNNIRKS
jgi:hypothetical protein